MISQPHGSCNREECAFDVGDCGINLVADILPGVMLSAHNAAIVRQDAIPTDSSISERAREALKEQQQTLAAQQDPPIALSVPAGTLAAYFNLSQVFPHQSNLTFEKVRNKLPAVQVVVHV